MPDKNWLIELTKPISDEAESIVAGSIKSIGRKSIWDAEGKKNKLK